MKSHLFFIFILILPFSLAASSIDYVSYGYLLNHVCLLGGACYFSNLTIIDQQTVNGTVDAWDLLINETSIFELFIPSSSNWNHTPIDVKTINSTEIQAERYTAYNSTYPQISDGDFLTGTGWTFGGNWIYDITNKRANHTAIGNTDILQLNPSLTIEADKGYELTFDYIAGAIMQICASIGDSPYQCVTGTTQKTAILRFTAVSTGNLKFKHEQLAPPYLFYSGWVDNVIVKQIGDSEAVAKYVSTSSANIKTIGGLDTIKPSGVLTIDTTGTDITIDSSATRTLTLGNPVRDLSHIYTDELTLGTSLTTSEVSLNDIINKDDDYVSVKTELRIRDALKLPQDTYEIYSCTSTYKGYLSYNTSNNKFVGCNGTEWVVLG